MVMLIGLLGKNAVLIVEFAVQRHRAGDSVFKDAVAGSAVRFRPILMTSFAFIAGLIPLVFATGPGRIGNRTIGSAAAGGMLIGTVFGVLIIPGLYYIFAKISERHIIVKDEEENPLTEEIDHNV
jgi:HAE1 family hydrophobic/amphiphilic exporter-1